MRRTGDRSEQLTIKTTQIQRRIDCSCRTPEHTGIGLALCRVSQRLELGSGTAAQVAITSLKILIDHSFSSYFCQLSILDCHHQWPGVLGNWVQPIRRIWIRFWICASLIVHRIVPQYRVISAQRRQNHIGPSCPALTVEFVSSFSIKLRGMSANQVGRICDRLRPQALFQ